jgi:hypothetical protein
LPHPILIWFPLLLPGPTPAGITHPISGPGGIAIAISIPVYVPVAVDVNVHMTGTPVAVVAPGRTPEHSPGETGPE